MNSRPADLTVAELAREGVLLVEDGNHGEYRPRSQEFGTSGVAFIRAADMGDGGIDFASASKINDVALRRIRKGFGKPGDILFSHKGTVGKLALVPPDSPPFVCSPQTTFWRSLDGKRLDQRFLYFYMQSREFREQWFARKGETDMADYVSLTAQRTLRVLLPPLPEQKVIAGVLGALDDKIKLNRQMNRTLESMATALFKSWFIDFDPVVAKAEGRKPYGMDAGTASLFPAEFVETDLGPIPRGWRWERLDQVAHFQNGLALQRFRPAETERRLPVVKIAQLHSGSPDSGEWASAEIDPACVLADGDVVFSWSATLMIRVWCGGPAALNQHLFKVTSDSVPKWFYHRWTGHHLPDFQAIASDKATTMGHIRRHHLSEAMCVVPPSPVLLAGDELAGRWLQLLIDNELESRTIAALRDLLLPPLLSGEMRLKDAERAVEEAL